MGLKEPRDKIHEQYIRYWHNQPEPSEDDHFRWFNYWFYKVNYKPIDNINKKQ